MRNNNIQHQNNTQEETSFNICSLKSMLEAFSKSIDLRVFGEIGVALFVHFQLLYLQQEYTIHTAVVIVPLLLYSCYQVLINIYNYKETAIEQQRLEYTNYILNWATLWLYQVIFFLFL